MKTKRLHSKKKFRNQELVLKLLMALKLDQKPYQTQAVATALKQIPEQSIRISKMGTCKENHPGLRKLSMIKELVLSPKIFWLEKLLNMEVYLKSQTLKQWQKLKRSKARAKREKLLSCLLKVVLSFILEANKPVQNQKTDQVHPLLNKKKSGLKSNASKQQKK